MDNFAERIGRINEESTWIIERILVLKEDLVVTMIIEINLVIGMVSIYQ